MLDARNISICLRSRALVSATLTMFIDTQDGSTTTEPGPAGLAGAPWGPGHVEAEVSSPPMVSDTKLLRAWRDGNKAKGQELCERYFDPVARFFANKLGDQTADLVQETFLAIVQGRDRITEDARFRSYLFSVAYNVLKKHLKRRYRLPEDYASCSLHDLAPGAETVMREAENLRLLKTALRRIPLDLQVALELRYWEKMSSTAISQVLGLPAATVRTHLRRARLLLEDALREQAAHPEVVEDTISNLDGWAEQLRGLVLQVDVAS